MPRGHHENTAPRTVAQNDDSGLLQAVKESLELARQRGNMTCGNREPPTEKDRSVSGRTGVVPETGNIRSFEDGGAGVGPARASPNTRTASPAGPRCNSSGENATRRGGSGVNDAMEIGKKMITFIAYGKPIRDSISANLTMCNQAGLRRDIGAIISATFRENYIADNYEDSLEDIVCQRCGVKFTDHNHSHDARACNYCVEQNLFHCGCCSTVEDLTHLFEKHKVVW